MKRKLKNNVSLLFFNELIIFVIYVIKYKYKFM